MEPNREMTEEKDNASGGMSIADIYYVLFRRKWIIIAFTLVGLTLAGTAYVLKPARYRSRAVLYIKYIAEPKALAPPGTELSAQMLNNQQTSILRAETRMIQSAEVAQQVVNVIGAHRLLATAGGGNDFNSAVDLVQNSMEIETDPQSGGVVSIIFQHEDPKIPEEALRQIIDGYVRKHNETRMGLDSELIDREIEHCRRELAGTEQRLREAKEKAGVTDVDEAKKDYARQIANARGELFRARAELTRYQAALDELARVSTPTSSSNNTEEVIRPELEDEYRYLRARLEVLAKEEMQLLSQFTPNSMPVTEKRKQIAQVKETKRQLEAKYPRLAAAAYTAPIAGAQPAAAFDPVSAAVNIRALRSQTNEWSTQLTLLQAQATRIEEMEGTILDLERTRKTQEEKLAYYMARREQARFDTEFGASKAPNIVRIDPPAPAAKARPKSFIKKVQMVAVGGFVAGVGLAFLIEMFLDRSVKRPVDVERKARLPLFISIPKLGRHGMRRLVNGNGKAPLLLKDGEPEPASEPAPSLPVAVWDRGHPLRRFYAGLRDRLITYFEIRNANQKPKLVAVTSCGEGVGVSSIAAGLAASLSETGDGNVLLVDMNADQGASQQFHKGKPGCGLDDALESETMKSAMVQSHLYVATELVGGANLPRVLPKRFDNLMPKLKASDYDYIIFDMPPVSQTSMTPRVARLMDMVLLVIESGKTSQDVVKQATALLAESKANVSAVLNKTRTYIPSFLQQELSDA